MTYTYLGNGSKYKERRTDTHVYFVGGPFSQWWTSEFLASPWASIEPMGFISCEQYMMAGKALLFHDVDRFDLIMSARDPGKIKQHGREVKNFDPIIWDACAKEIVYRGNLAKFTQDEQLRDYMLATGDRIFVEGAIYDKVWGVKLAWDDPAIEDEKNWLGSNWLGQCLDRVKKEIM